MIRGQVNPNVEAIVGPIVRCPTGTQLTVHAVIDTGFAPAPSPPAAEIVALATGVAGAVAAFVVPVVLVGLALRMSENRDNRGQTLSAVVSVRLCRECRRALHWHKFGRSIRYTVMGLVIGGLLAAYVWSPWALLVLPAAALLGWVGRRIWRREQVYLQSTLRLILVYRELFDRYPTAAIRPG